MYVLMTIFSSDRLLFLSLKKNSTMTMKSDKIKFDDLTCWNIGKSFHNNQLGDVDDEERSIAQSVNLLLKNKNISQTNLEPLPSHLVSSENCQCHRSFHIFCTQLFPFHDSNTDMIYIHPAPRNYERDTSRRVSTSLRKSRQKHYEENDHETMTTGRSEPSQLTIPESQLSEKKLRIPPKLPSRTASFNTPSPYHSPQRSRQSSNKYSSSVRISKPPPPLPSSNVQLYIHALSIFDQSPSASHFFPPRGPPPSPKTPTLESSMLFSHPTTPAPFRAVSITPHIKNRNEHQKKLSNISSIKNINYEDHAREYLSASDCSDNEKDKDDNDDEEKDKDLNHLLTITKPKLPQRNLSLSRPGTSLRDRLLSHNASHYLNLAEVYYTSLDVYKNLSEKSRRRSKSGTHVATTTTNENDDASTTITRTTTTTKTVPTAPSKSVFGFSKTASSMHFGHAAGRLGLHASFEKWPQPLSRRTPIERKQAITALRLVTLPLVAS